VRRAREPGETRERVLAFVGERLFAGRPPTVRDVQRAFGFRAVQTAREHLEKLVSEGRLAKEAGIARGYRLPEGAEGPDGNGAPLLGRVAAGPLAAAIQDADGYVAVELRSSTGARVAGRARHRELFALRVRGESMRDAGILDGDVAIVERRPDASDGDVVVARIGEEATVKKLRRRGGRIELLPANPAFAPIRMTAEESAELAILGRVIEVRRYLDRDRAPSA
jgi:repressor LexA